MRRAVTEAASVANDAPMAGTPSARPFPICLATYLLRNVPSSVRAACILSIRCITR